MRRARTILLWCAAALALLALLAVALLRTGPGHATLGWAVARLSGGSVTVHGLHGHLPDEVMADSVEIADAQGVWLRADDVALDWSALSALDNRFLIQHIHAARITVLRRPVPDEKTEGTTPEIAVDALDLPDIEIATPVIGRAARLSARGNAHYVSERTLQADLEVARLDAPDRYRIHGGLDDSVARGTIDIAESGQGFLGALLGFPGLEPVRARADASGGRGANRIAFRLAAGALTGSGAGTIALDARKIDFDISLRAPAMQPSADIAWNSLAFDGHVHGTFDAPALKGALHLAQVKAAGLGFADLSAAIAGDGGSATLTGTGTALTIPGDHPDLFAKAPLSFAARVDLKAATRPVTVSLSHPLMSLQGSADTRGPLRANARVTVPALAPFAALEGADIAGRAAFTLTAEQDAQATRLTLETRLSLEGSATIARVLGHDALLKLDATTQGADIVRSETTLRSSGATAHVTGTFRKGQLNYAVTASLLDLSRVMPSLQGDLSFSGSATGPLQSARLQAQGSAVMASKGFARQRIAFGLTATGLPDPKEAHVTARGGLDGAPLDLAADLAPMPGGRGAKLDAHWKSLAAKASFALPKAGAVTGSAKLAIGQLSDLQSLLGRKLAGRMDADIDLKPGRAGLRAAMNDLAAQEGRLSSARLEGAIADPFGKPSFALALAARGLEAQGFVGDADAKIDGPEAKLGIALAADLRDPSGAPLRAMADAEVDAGKRRVALKRFSGSWRALSATLAAPATIDLAQGVAVDRLALGVAGGSLRLSGRLAPKLDAELSAQGVDLAMLAPLMPGAAVEGTLGGSAALTGTLDAPEGRFALEGHGLRLRDYSARALAPADLDARGMLHGKSARLDATLAAEKSAHLTVEGDAPLTAQGALALHLSGSADLVMFNPLLSANGRQVRGTVALDLQAAGTQAAPRLSGAATLADAAFQDYANGIRVHGIAATLRAEGSTLRIAQFSAQAGQGTIGATGTIAPLAPGIPVDMVFTLKNARPVTSDLMRASISGNLKLAGRLGDATRLSGQLRVQRGEIDLPERFPPTVAVLKVRRPGAPGTPEPPPSGTTSLDLTVAADGPIFVRGNGIDADFGGRIHLTGTTAMPAAGGGFIMNRGTFAFAGQTLDFTTGKISFDGTGVRGRLDPTLDLVAQSASGGVTATLTVSGYASQPKISLSSAPQLPQDEVLAHLLFQQSVKQLTALQLAQIAQGVAALGGVGSGFNPLGALRKGLGLDRLSVGSTAGASGSAQQTTIEAGKYVAHNVYVGTKQNLSGGTQVQVQYDITKRLKAQATISTGTNATATTGNAAQDNGSNAGLSYQFEY